MKKCNSIVALSWPQKVKKIYEVLDGLHFFVLGL